MTNTNHNPSLPKLSAKSVLATLNPLYTAAIATRTAAAVVTGGSKAAATQVGKTATRALSAHLKQVVGPAAAKKLVGAGGKVAGRAVAVLAVAEFGVKQTLSYRDMQAGKIDAAEYRRQTGGNIGSTAGGAGGAALGAVIGTAALPGVGTAIGAFVGGVLGGWGGEEAGRRMTA